MMLFNLIRDKLGQRVDFDFSLWYSFDWQLCRLMDIQKLPQKPVLKLIRSKSDAGSIGTADIETLPHLPLADCPQGPV